MYNVCRTKAIKVNFRGAELNINLYFMVNMQNNNEDNNDPRPHRLSNEFEQKIHNSK